MKEIFLLKDTSELSREVEEYLISNNYLYYSLYGKFNSHSAPPLIFVPGRTIPYEGAGGFNRFKDTIQIYCPKNSLSSNA